MRFIADGPSIPDDLLIALDQGRVVFFCGAGVSQARAGLSNFADLAKKVLDRLGAGRGSPARRLLAVALETPAIEGVGNVIATDRVFSLLEREFEASDIYEAVSVALQSAPDVDVSAHRVILDLAGHGAEDIRLVTTNFDRLFERCDPEIQSFGPLHLPDLKRTDIRGIIHFHGRVKEDYSGADEEGFVLSSSDFGKAYLADGWATRFIQSLLAKYSIVFLGYSADDPPVHYLLEALKGSSQARGRMFAFQAGENAAVTALWDQKGVTAIPYSSANYHSALWKSLEAWAIREKDVDDWHDSLLRNAANGPSRLPPYQRGQVAHIASTAEGCRRIIHSVPPLPASWINVFDKRERYRTPLTGLQTQDPSSTDPFNLFAIDSDLAPKSQERERPQLYGDREVPADSWDALSIMEADLLDLKVDGVAGISGVTSSSTGILPERLNRLGIWLRNVAHQEEALAWGIQQSSVHPRIVSLISSALAQYSERFSIDVAKGWSYLVRIWSDDRKDPDQ